MLWFCIRKSNSFHLLYYGLVELEYLEIVDMVNVVISLLLKINVLILIT